MGEVEQKLAIDMRNITKTFGTAVANNKVNLQVKYGEVLSLLGENGSGKTTLMNMLSGIYFPDAGQIFIKGQEVTIRSPHDALELGIGMVHQHFKLVDVFSATENVILGLKEKESRRQVEEKIQKICDKYGFEVDPKKKVYDMSVAEKQTLEIVKVLYRGADILILDEPTAVLTPQETKRLFKVMQNMKADGKAIIIITHKLNEVLSVSDCVTILRKGEYVGTVPTSEATESSLTEMMVGKKVELNIDRPVVEQKEIRLKVEHVSVDNEYGVSVLDEYYWLNKHDPNYSLCRATVNRGKDAHTDGKFNLSQKGCMEIMKLFMTKDEDLYDKTIEDVFDEEVFDSTFWLYWRTMFAFENWHSALEMKLYFQRFIHHIAGLPDFSALKFTKYNQYESLILPMQRYLEDAGVDFQFNTEVTNVVFKFEGDKKIASAIECKVNGQERGIVLTENDLVFVTNGSCTEGTIYGDQNHAPNGDAEVRTSGVWNLWKNIARQDPSFGHPEKFCSDIAKTNWESATVTTLDDKIIPYITDICKRDPRTGNVVTGGIVSCQDSSWLLSWTINRQGQFKDQDKDKVCVWVYGLFTDVPGDYIKKPMKDCTGKEITAEWLYHLGVPEDQIMDLAENSAICVPTMMPYITAFFMPRTKGDRPDVIPDGCVNFAFLGQFAETPRDTVFTTEYSVRTAMEAVYGLLKVDRGVPEVWGSVYDIRELLDSSVKLMDGKSPLEIQLPGPLNALKKPLLKLIKGNVIEKVLRDHNVLKDGM